MTQQRVKTHNERRTSPYVNNRGDRGRRQKLEQ